MADHQIADDRVHLTFCDGDGTFYVLSGDSPPASMGPRACALARAALDLAQRNLDQLDSPLAEITFAPSMTVAEQAAFRARWTEMNVT